MLALEQPAIAAEDHRAFDHVLQFADIARPAMGGQGFQAVVGNAFDAHAVFAGETLHEERDVLGAEILDRHRAISTIMEELEAIDWYDQRIKASSDPELKAVLAHNRNEEKEHATMLLEWLRRHDPELDGHLRTYLFSQGPIREVKEGGGTSGPGLSIGTLKG